MSTGTNNNDVDDTNRNNRMKSLNPKVYKDLKKIEQEGREKGLTEKEIYYASNKFEYTRIQWYIFTSVS